MSREQQYQQGKFENYFPGRNEISIDAAKAGSGSDYEVRRRYTTGVGGAPDPDRPGFHRGKGPRNYRRSDQRILEDINDRLCDNPYIDASEIDVSVSGGNVALTGSADDKASKRLAEDIVESVSGVGNVENNIKVKIKGI